MSTTPKQRCKYWDKCYRKNEEHLEQFLHPQSHRDDNQKTRGSATSSSKVAKNSSEKPEQSQKSPGFIKKNSESVPNSRNTPSATSLPSKSVFPSTSKSKVVTGKTRLHAKSVTNSCGSGEDTKSSGKRNQLSDMDASTSASAARKRQRTRSTIKHDRYYFTKVVGHPDKFSENIALSFRDVLSLDGKLTTTWQFTFMVDLDWLLEEYPDNAAEGPILLFLGDKQAKEVQDRIMRQKTTCQPKKYSRIVVVPVSLPLTYGTHHTKLMVLQSEGGVRVVVHTANLVQSDWTVKTQGVWVSPLCPAMSEHDSPAGGSDFKSYLLKYLEAYKTSATDQLVRILSKYDMSGVTQVKLVGSVPGLHTNRLFGLYRLEQLLSRYVDHSRVRPGWRVVTNCSSIGSLGSDSADWLDHFVSVLQAGNSSETSRPALFQLVFPTVDMIRNSLEGYCGGGSVPYQLKTHSRQPWLRAHMCNWDCKDYGRSRVVPHIKTYTRLAPDMKSVAWFLLTSANLSKAAWGQKLSDGRLRVRSYELGVLFVGPEPLKVYNKETDSGMLVPYSLPPRPYGKADKPWIADVAYSQLDTHGNKWPIDLVGENFDID
ncbi:hypothetical protein ACHWQZ_G013351 [Mnemiopsis leidyi]